MGNVTEWGQTAKTVKEVFGRVKCEALLSFNKMGYLSPYHGPQVKMID